MAPKHKTMNLISTFFSLQFCVTSSQAWIQTGYWYAGSESPIPDINSALFTHLLCGFAEVNTSNHRLSVPSSDEQYFSNFTRIVMRKNPSVATLLSVWNGQAEIHKAKLGEKSNSSALSSMLNGSSSRKAFVADSIRTARRYGFQGLDLFWVWPNSVQDMTGLGILLDEFREAVDSESRNSARDKLILTMAVHYVPEFESATYPIESMARNLDWAHVVAYDYHLPTKENVTGAHSALYDPHSHTNTDYGIRQWLSRGFPSTKLAMGLPHHGYAWTLVDPRDSSVGARASGLAVTKDGSMSYKDIKSYTRSYGAEIVYNSSYVVNYCVIGSTWIGFDDVEAVRAKIEYTKSMKLIGYNVFLLTNDDDLVLSRAAQGKQNRQGNKLLIILLPIAFVVVFLAILMCYVERKDLRSKGMRLVKKFSLLKNHNEEDNENFDSDAPNPILFSFNRIKDATNNFSSENKLGEGGFGIVYKGKLPRGPEIAVKRLSKTSTQGVEEFKNEVLTARLQHVNLSRVLGYCTERDEKMLIYAYMPKRSLDIYIFDPIKRLELDWMKRVQIVEGIIQGLLYLQEYSNFTIIHRDLKSSNILLDNDMNPKISDFGMAKLFGKDEIEANTDRIVGTYGYVPPEYAKKGTYSMKFDVYSFGVLLLQIISGKRNTRYYGPSESLHLLDYAYQTWVSDRGVDFFDPSLDDSSSACKLAKCLQVALLCVQENREDRPSMLEVFAMLRDETKAVGAPKRPAFSVKIDGGPGSASTPQQAFGSAQFMSISEIIPR